MTEIQPPGYLQNAGAVNTAENLRNALQVLMSGSTGAASLKARGGVHPALGNLLKVQQAGAPNMTVDVLSGVAMVPGTEGPKQGSYFCLSDSTKSVAITAANASLPRLDAIVAKVQDSFYSGATNSWSIVSVTGTANASPVLPTLPANSILIASVAVAANVTSIVNANITDNRVYLTAVGGITPVANQAERDALGAFLYDGFVVYRRDTKALEIWNLSTWIVMRDKGSAGASAQAVTSGTDTMTSATYVNLAGTGSVTSFSFTKKHAGTKIRLSLAAGWTATTNNCVTRFSLQINGVDYDIGQSILAAGGIGHVSGATLVGAGVVAAGTYTVQARWKRFAGSGTANRSVNEWLSIDAVEID